MDYKRIYNIIESNKEILDRALIRQLETLKFSDPELDIIEHNIRLYNAKTKPATSGKQLDLF